MSSIWSDRAVRLLNEALDQIRDDEDATPAVGAALAALRIELGELPESELDGYPFPGEDSGPPCTCPPELRARGGYASSCRADHGYAAGES